MAKITKEDAIARFGFNPECVGERHRGFWIVDRVEDEEESAGASLGDLCIKARDGSGNPPDCNAGSFGRYIGTAEDGFDSTYRYYYYRAIDKEADRANR